MMPTADRFENRYKALGAELFASGRRVGESQADTLLDLHKLVDWSIRQNHEVDYVMIYDLRDPLALLFLCKMVRDETGVWTQTNATDEPLNGEFGPMYVGAQATSNLIAASKGPDGTILDEKVWGETFALGQADHIMNWMAALDRLDGGKS